MARDAQRRRLFAVLPRCEILFHVYIFHCAICPSPQSSPFNLAVAASGPPQPFPPGKRAGRALRGKRAFWRAAPALEYFVCRFNQVEQQTLYY